jgi:hypothetical protein
VTNEATKLLKLKPSRYVLATSLGLTPANVDELYSILTPFCTSKHDIVDKTNLNAILRANSDIERRHPKLWIASEAVLNRALQGDVFVQSDLTREAILRRLSLYVYTSRFEDARNKLDADRACIIAGVPGVGKTTLAEMLLIEHIRDGWELITVRQNVSEALRTLQAHPDVKQVFYYDDFLGQVSVGEKLAKNEDGALVQILHALQYRRTKRLILTTREYILAQAERDYEKLARANLDVYRFVIECRDYDKEAKARILANHLSHVPSEHIAAIIREKGYRKIIEHPNYNPRLVETMTSRLKVRGTKPAEYLEAFIACLDDPSELWKSAYEAQLSEASRQLLLTMLRITRPASLSLLEQDFDAFFGQRCRELAWVQRTNDFERSLNELEGNFIRIRQNGNEKVVEWHNPSVIDFLGAWLRRHWRDTEALVATATRFAQIEELVNTVLVLVPPDDEVAISLPHETVLAEAMERTLVEVDITWQHLQTMFRLCGLYTDGAVRLLTQQVATALFDTLERVVVDTSIVVAILGEAKECSWIETSQLDRWKSQLKMYCLSMEDEWFDTLDAFMPIARWVAGNRELFSQEEYEGFGRLARKVVDSESHIDPFPNMESIWVEMKDSVTELQRLLTQDLKRELERIEERIESAEKPQISSQPFSKRETVVHATPIDSLFDALLHGCQGLDHAGLGDDREPAEEDGGEGADQLSQYDKMA